VNAAAFVFVSRSVPKGSYFLTYGSISAARFIQLTLQLPVCCWYGQSKGLGSHGIVVSQYGINRELDLSLSLVAVPILSVTWRLIHTTHPYSPPQLTHEGNRHDRELYPIVQIPTYDTDFVTNRNCPMLNRRAIRFQ
jgi:hypothetical protein